MKIGKPRREKNAVGRVKRSLAGSIAATLGVASLTIAGTVAGVAPAYAADALACDSSTVWAQDNSGNVRKVTVSDTTLSIAGSNTVTTQNNNGLAISSDGKWLYTGTNTAGTSKTITIRNVEAATQTTRTISGTGDYLIRGAVHPATGIYYFTGYSWVGAYNPATDTTFRVGTLTTPGVTTPAIGNSNGDMAFGANGELYVLVGDTVFTTTAALPTVAGSGNIPLKKVVQLDDVSAANGIAFGNGGELVISAGSSIYRYDLTTGKKLATASQPSGFSASDLASCSFPNTLSFKVDLKGERVNAGDQFTMTLTGTSDTDRIATTTGSATSIQSEYAGPEFTKVGNDYGVQLGAAGTTAMADYSASALVCTDSSGTTVPTTGSFPNWTLNYPSGSSGRAVECLIELTPKAAEVTVTVQWLDEDSHSIAPSVPTTGTPGDPFTPNPLDPEPEEYILIKEPDSPVTELPEEDTTYTYVYAKAGTVVVEYVDVDGNPVAAEVALGKKKVGTDYTSTPADVAGYELISTPANAAGSYIQGQTVVTYVYKPVDPEPVIGNVTVEYVDEDGTPIAPPVGVEGPVGDPYTSTALNPEPPLYMLVKTPEAPNGDIPEDPITLTYVYAKAGTVVVKYVDANGNPVAAEDALGKKKVGTEYTSAPKTVDGYYVTAVPSNANGDYIQGETVVTYVYAALVPVTVEYVDEDGNPIEPPVNITGKPGDPFTPTPLNPEPEDYILIEEPENPGTEIPDEETTYTYVYAKAGTVVVKYVDANGNPVAAEDALGKKKVGTEYTSAPETVPGYVLVTTPANAAGSYVEGQTVVTYVYAKTGTVTVEYVDEDGNPIEAPETITDPIGDEYTTNPVDAEDWILVETPDNANGEVTEDPTTVTYVYAKAGTVVVKYVDADGNPVAAEDALGKKKVGTEYTSAPETVPGYVLVTTPANAAGSYVQGATTVTYVYAPAGDIVVEYVDEDGNPLADPESNRGPVGGDYSTTAKQIPGYELVKVPANASGEYSGDPTKVTYVYKKIVPVAPAENGGLAVTGEGVGIGLGIATLALIAGGAALLVRRRNHA